LTAAEDIVDECWMGKRVNARCGSDGVVDVDLIGTHLPSPLLAPSGGTGHSGR
jgi:hypothetical protein